MDDLLGRQASVCTLVNPVVVTMAETLGNKGQRAQGLLLKEKRNKAEWKLGVGRWPELFWQPGLGGPACQITHPSETRFLLRKENRHIQAFSALTGVLEERRLVH